MKLDLSQSQRSAELQSSLFWFRVDLNFNDESKYRYLNPTSTHAKLKTQIDLSLNDESNLSLS